MPQGDLHFFSYDVTAVLGAFGLGYLLFVGLFAPRVVAILRSRSLLVPVRAPTETTRGNSTVRAVDLLSVAPAVAASETFLSFVQFGLLTLLVYSVVSGRLTPRHRGVPVDPPPPRVPPNFGVYSTVGVNLVVLWSGHREVLFFRPAAATLIGVTTTLLRGLVRPVPPQLFPRLVAVVKESARGLKGV